MMLQIDCINNDKSKIAFHLDGQIIRSSYLLADTVRVSGTSYMAVDFENQFANPGAWLKKKLVLDFCARVPDPEYLKVVEKMYEIIENGKKNIKHPTKEIIVARKKCEKTLDELYQNSIQDMRNVFLNSGYLGLLPLEEEGSLEMWGSNSGNPESSANGGVPCSEMLSSKWINEDELYAFTDTFWEFAQEQNLKLSSFDEQGKDGTVLMFPLPVFVPLASFTATELKAIKQEIFGDMPEMRKSLEDWSVKLKTENFSPNNFDNYRSYFASCVNPYVNTAKERVEHCSLLRKVSNFFKREVGFENYLAIASAKTAWNFMEWSGMVPGESMHAFEENMPEGCNGDKAVLLFLSKSFNHQMTDEAGDKKSLQL